MKKLLLGLCLLALSLPSFASVSQGIIPAYAEGSPTQALEQEREQYVVETYTYGVCRGYWARLAYDTGVDKAECQATATAISRRFRALVHWSWWPCEIKYCIE